MREEILIRFNARSVKRQEYWGMFIGLLLHEEQMHR